jgi:hypothetical protein
MKTIKKTLCNWLCLMVVSLATVLASCTKEELVPEKSVAAPLVPGGAVISKMSLQQENQKFSTLSNCQAMEHETKKGILQNNQ